MSKRTHQHLMSEDGQSAGKRSSTDPIKQEREAERILLELSSLFPVEKFDRRVPRVVMKHMIYSCMPNRTKADKELVRNNISIGMFKYLFRTAIDSFIS